MAFHKIITPILQMYTLEHKSEIISVNQFISKYRDAERFIEYCKQCKNYGKVWSCPPYNHDVDSLLLKYKEAIIIFTKIKFDQDFINSCSGSQEKVRSYSEAVLKEVRTILDNVLIQKQKENKGTLAFFAGSCQFCPEDSCNKQKGLPCRHPDKAHTSLEAYGFDIGKILSDIFNTELKWASPQSLPEYYSLVSGFFIS